MNVTCPSCGAKYKVKDEKIPAGGMILPCPKCKANIKVAKPQGPVTPSGTQLYMPGITEEDLRKPPEAAAPRKATAPAKPAVPAKAAAPAKAFAPPPVPADMGPGGFDDESSFADMNFGEEGSKDPFGAMDIGDAIPAADSGRRGAGRNAGGSDALSSLMPPPPDMGGDDFMDDIFSGRKEPAGKPGKKEQAKTNASAMSMFIAPPPPSVDLDGAFGDDDVQASFDALSAKAAPVKGKNRGFELPPDLPDFDMGASQDGGADLPDFDMEAPKDSGADLPDFDMEVPKDSGADFPDFDMEAPKDSGTDFPDFDMEAPKDSGADFPDFDMEAPKDGGTDFPDFDMENPDKATQVPDFSMGDDGMKPPAEGDELPDFSFDMGADHSATKLPDFDLGSPRGGGMEDMDFPMPDDAMASGDDYGNVHLDGADADLGIDEKNAAMSELDFSLTDIGDDLGGGGKKKGDLDDFFGGASSKKHDDFGAPGGDDSLFGMDQGPADFGDFGDPGETGTEAGYGAPEEVGGGNLLDQIVELTAGEEGVKLYKVRKKSGRVFGPFPVSTIMEMFKTKKLSTDDQIAAEGQGWTSILDLPEVRELAGDIAEADLVGGLGGGPAAPGIGAPGPSRRRTITQSLFEAKSAGKAPSRRKAPFIIASLAVVFVIIVAAELYMRLAAESSLLNLVIPEDPASKINYSALSATHRDLYNQAEDAILNDVFVAAEDAEKKMDSVVGQPEFKGRPAMVGMDATLKLFMLKRYGEEKSRLKQVEALLQKDVRSVADPVRSILLTKGMKLLLDGRYEDARITFQKALQLSVTKYDALATHLIAWTFLDTDDYLQGEKQLMPIIKGNKAQPFTYYLMSRFAIRASQKDQARAYLETTLKKNPKHLASRIALVELDAKVPARHAEVEQRIKEILDNDMKDLPRAFLAQMHFILSEIYAARHETFNVTKALNNAIKSDPYNPEYTAALGEFLFKTHEVAKAEKEFERCLKISEKAAACHIGLAKCYLLKGKPDKALKQLQDGAQLVGKTSDIAYFLGVTLEHQKLNTRALKYYEDAISLNPKEVRYYAKAAKIYLLSDNIVKASEFIQKAKSVDPDSPYVHNFLGEMYVFKNELDLSIGEFKAAMDSDASFIEAYINLGDTYRQLNRHTEAMDVLNRAMQIDEKNPKAHFVMGRTLLAMDNLEGAVSQLEMAVKYDDATPLHHYYLGLAYYELKRYADAANALKSEVELNLEYAPAHYLLGKVMFESKKWQEAIKSFENAINLDKQNPEYHFWMGKLHTTSGREKSAIEYLDAAISLKPDFADAWLFKGLSLLKSRQYRKAKESLTKALSYDSKMTPAYMARAQCHRYFKSNTKAEDDYQKTIKLNPEYSLPYYELGRLYQEMGQDRKGMDYLQKARKLDPAFADVYWALGFAYKKARSRAEAIKNFKTYLELRPNAVDAQDVREEIEQLRQ